MGGELEASHYQLLPSFAHFLSKIDYFVQSPLESNLIGGIISKLGPDFWTRKIKVLREGGWVENWSRN